MWHACVTAPKRPQKTPAQEILTSKVLSLDGKDNALLCPALPCRANIAALSMTTTLINDKLERS